MIYINRITLPSLDKDRTDSWLAYSHKTIYPFHVLSYRGLFNVDFDDITIVTGGNGTGKSTLLNVIAEKLKLHRHIPFNNSAFFKDYLTRCTIEESPESYQLSGGLNAYSRIITSDEVFDSMIETRLMNEAIDERRKAIEKEIDGLKEQNFPKGIDLSNAESHKLYLKHLEVRKKTKSQYIKEHLGFNLAENSNGENAFRFFTEAIKPGALYLLDEPENSLSAERQIDLSEWIASMARYEKCQFIISTHSPFIMSTAGATLYNLDVYPARVMPWTEVSSVKVYHDFFMKHSAEFCV